MERSCLYPVEFVGYGRGAENRGLFLVAARTLTVKHWSRYYLSVRVSELKAPLSM
jgi:hypothetical protein